MSELTKEKMYALASNKSGIAESRLKTFINAMGENGNPNKRYELLYQWTYQKAIKLRHFRILIHNIKTTSIDTFILKGERIFITRGNGGMPEDFMVT